MEARYQHHHLRTYFIHFTLETHETDAYLTRKSEILYSGGRTVEPVSRNAFRYSATPTTPKITLVLTRIRVDRRTTCQRFHLRTCRLDLSIYEISISRKAAESAFLNINPADRICNIRYDLTSVTRYPRGVMIIARICFLRTGGNRFARSDNFVSASGGQR